MSGAAFTPRVRDLLLCDWARENPYEEGVFNLKGVRHALTGEAFPFRPRRLALFLVLTYAHAGRFPGYVTVMESATEKMIFYSKFEVAFDGMDDTLALPARLKCRFDHPAEYTVQVWFFQPEGPDVQKGERTFRVLAGGE